MRQLNKLKQFNKLKQLNKLKTLNKLKQFNRLKQFDKLKQFSKLKQFNKLKQFKMNNNKILVFLVFFGQRMLTNEILTESNQCRGPTSWSSSAKIL